MMICFLNFAIAAADPLRVGRNGFSSLLSHVMYSSSFDPKDLIDLVWQRRDLQATPEQEVETRNLEVAFQQKAVLLSRARIKAEAYLQQN